MRTGSDQYVSFLLDRTRTACRNEGYSVNTEERYLYWVHRFLNDCGVSAPGDLRAESARAFLRTLQDCTYSTRKQAHNALGFLFDEVLVRPIGEARIPADGTEAAEWASLHRMRAPLETEAGTVGSDRSFARPGRASSPHPRGERSFSPVEVRGPARH